MMSIYGKCLVKTVLLYILTSLQYLQKQEFVWLNWNIPRELRKRLRISLNLYPLLSSPSQNSKQRLEGNLPSLGRLVQTFSPVPGLSLFWPEEDRSPEGQPCWSGSRQDLSGSGSNCVLPLQWPAVPSVPVPDRSPCGAIFGTWLGLHCQTSGRVIWRERWGVPVEQKVLETFLFSISILLIKHSKHMLLWYSQHLSFILLSACEERIHVLFINSFLSAEGSFCLVWKCQQRWPPNQDL